MFGQIFKGHQAAVGLGAFHYLFGQIPSIKGLPHAVGNHSQCSCLVLTGKQLSGRRSLCPWQKGLLEIRKILKPVHRQGPAVGSNRGNDETLLGITDGRFKEFAKGELAELPGQFDPRIHGPRYCDGPPAQLRHAVQMSIVFIGPGPGRAPGSI